MCRRQYYKFCSRCFEEQKTDSTTVAYWKVLHFKCWVRKDRGGKYRENNILKMGTRVRATHRQKNPRKRTRTTGTPREYCPKSEAASCIVHIIILWRRFTIFFTSRFLKISVPQAMLSTHISHTTSKSRKRGHVPKYSIILILPDPPVTFKKIFKYNDKRFQ